MPFIKKPLCALLALLLTPIACGESDSQAPPSGTGGHTLAGSGGRTLASYGGASAGAPASFGGDGGVSGMLAGANAGGTSGGPVESGGSQSAGGSVSNPSGGSAGRTQSGGQSSVLAGGTSGGRAEPFAGAGGRAPSLCTRLGLQEQVLTGRVTWAYVLSVREECRVSGLYNPSTGVEVLNRFNAFNLELWGCNGATAQDFGLSLGAKPVGRKESELLISFYLDAANTYLQLSVSEKAKLKVDLQALAEPVITNESDGFVHATCVTGSGGESAGGAGAGGSSPADGATGGAGGAGGAR